MAMHIQNEYFMPLARTKCGGCNTQFASEYNLYERKFYPASQQSDTRLLRTLQQVEVLSEGKRTGKVGVWRWQIQGSVELVEDHEKAEEMNWLFPCPECGTFAERATPEQIVTNKRRGHRVRNRYMAGKGSIWACPNVSCSNFGGPVEAPKREERKVVGVLNDLKSKNRGLLALRALAEMKREYEKRRLARLGGRTPEYYAHYEIEDTGLGNVWAWGEYVNGKWRTNKHFCKGCFVEEVQSILHRWVQRGKEYTEGGRYVELRHGRAEATAEHPGGELRDDIQVRYNVTNKIELKMRNGHGGGFPPWLSLGEGEYVLAAAPQPKRERQGWKNIDNFGALLGG